MNVILQIIRNGKKFTADLTALIAETFTQNGEYKRDEKGQFAKADSKGEESTETQKASIAKTSGRGKVKRRRKVIELPKEEFAAVQHAFMSDVTEEQRKRKVLKKYIGDFLYIGILREDGTRDIIGKDPIE